MMRAFAVILLAGLVVASAPAQPTAGVAEDVLRQATINPDDLEHMLDMAPDDPAFRGRLLTQLADYHLNARDLDRYNAAIDRFLDNWPDPPADALAALGQAALIRNQMDTALAAFSEGGPDPKLQANDLATARFAAELAARFTPPEGALDEATAILETLAERFKAQRRGFAERAVLQRLYDLHPEPEARKPYLMRLSHLSIQYFRDVRTAGSLMVEWADHQKDPEQEAIYRHAAAICYYLAEDYGTARALLDALWMDAPDPILPRVGVADVLVKIRTADFDGALRVIDRQIQAGQPADVEAHLMALHAYVQTILGHTHEAVDAFTALLDTHPNARFTGTVKRILHALTEEPPLSVNTPAPAGATPNIVFISLDTVRPDFLGCYGGAATPAIDALAAAGTVFEQAYSTSSWTKAAHGSVFTGLSPYAHGAMGHRDALAAGAGLLQENLRDAGYTTAGAVSAPPLNRLYGFARGFDEYDDYTFDLDRTADLFQHGMDAKVRIHSGRTGSLITDAAVQALHRARRPGHPFFLFVNYFDAHHNYEPRMPYSMEVSKDYYGYHWGNVDELLMSPMPFEEMRPYVEIERLRALYAAEVREVDDEVARLVAHLKETGAYDNTIFVLFADHGEEFLEHDQLTHGKSLYEEVLRVPLILAGPGIEAGRRIDVPVSLVDIAPTVIALTGAPALRDCDAPSLLEPIPDRRIHAELDLPGYTLESMLQDGMKLIRNRGVASKKLYDLVADPAESHNLRATEAVRVAELTVELDRHVTDARMLGFRLAGGESTEARGPVESLEALEEQLRAMGYLSGDATSTTQPAAPAPTPGGIQVRSFYEQPPGTFNAILQNTGTRDAALGPASIALPGHGAPVHTWWIDIQPAILAPGAYGVLRYALKRAKDAPQAVELTFAGGGDPLALRTDAAAWHPQYLVVDREAGTLYCYLSNTGSETLVLNALQVDGVALQPVTDSDLLIPAGKHGLLVADSASLPDFTGYHAGILRHGDTFRAVTIYDAASAFHLGWEAAEEADFFECPTHKHGPFDQAAQKLLAFRAETTAVLPTLHLCRNRLPAGLGAFAPLAPRVLVNPAAANLRRGEADAWQGYDAALDLIGTRIAPGLYAAVLDDTAPTAGAYGALATPEDAVITLDDARAAAWLAIAAGAKGLVVRARENNPNGTDSFAQLLDEIRPHATLLAIGAPAELVQNDPGDGIIARTLRCGDRAVLLVVLREAAGAGPVDLVITHGLGAASLRVMSIGERETSATLNADARSATVTVPQPKRLEVFLISTN